MTAAVVAIDAKSRNLPVVIGALLHDVAVVVRQIQETSDTAALLEAKAAVDAARAWAKAQKQIEEVRNELFLIETEALARIAQLERTDLLSTGQRRAADFLAGLTTEERRIWCAEWSKSAGTVQAAYTHFAAQQAREHARKRGREYAQNKRESHHEPGVEDADLSASPSEIINEIINGYVQTGEPFTIDDVVEAMLTETSPPSRHEEEAWREGTREGLREMVRFAVRNGECAFDKGQAIHFPKTITVRTWWNNGARDATWVRIPTPNATVADVLANLAMRDQQIEDLVNARDRFKQFADWALTAAAGDETARIGDLDREAVAA